MNNEPDAVYLGLLHDITIAANELDRLADVVESALRIICSATGWPVGHALIRAHDGMLRSTGFWYLAGEYSDGRLASFQQASENRRFAGNVGLPGRVLADGQPKWVTDLANEAGLPRQPQAIANGLASSFAFPLRSGADVVGVLEFYASIPHSADPAFLDVMAQVGIQLGRVFERQRAREVQQTSEQRTRQILDTAGDAFIGMDTSGCITGWNKAAVNMFGWSRDAVLGRDLSHMIVPPQYREAHRQGLQRYLATGVTRVLGKRLELSALDHAGREFPIEITLWSIKNCESVDFYAFARDITERKQRERELEQRAYYDGLTGLPNRKLLQDRLEQLLARRDRQGPALLFIDVDRFKNFNDSLGHAFGDRLLIAVSGVLREAVRPMDTVARLAGDEFIVVCPDVADYPAATAIAQRITASLATPVRIDTDSVFLTASMGIAIADENSDSESLIGAADTAMYQAKSSGRGQYELFDERMRLEVTSRLRIENELREALEKEQLRLYFQPIVNATGGDLAAVEALLRWQHPQRGLLTPAEFMPVAEDTGLIVPIGEWVLAEACRSVRTWQSDSQGQTPLCVSINLSARQLSQSNLISMFERTLASAAVDSKRIQFGIEVTETVVMRDPATAAATLARLKALGIRLAIDDFGIGYSSLAYLKHFPVDILKLDRSFMSGIVDDPADLAIVQAVTDMARSLRLSVIAEGVETEAQAQALRRVGVDMMQGFLYARPQPPEALINAAWILSNPETNTHRRVHSGD